MEKRGINTGKKLLKTRANSYFVNSSTACWSVSITSLLSSVEKELIWASASKNLVSISIESQNIFVLPSKLNFREFFSAVKLPKYWLHPANPETFCSAALKFKVIGLGKETSLPLILDNLHSSGIVNVFDSFETLQPVTTIRRIRIALRIILLIQYVLVIFNLLKYRLRKRAKWNDFVFMFACMLNSCLHKLLTCIFTA